MLARKAHLTAGASASRSLSVPGLRGLNMNWSAAAFDFGASDLNCAGRAPSAVAETDSQFT